MSEPTTDNDNDLWRVNQLGAAETLGRVHNAIKDTIEKYRYNPTIDSQTLANQILLSIAEQNVGFHHDTDEGLVQ